MMDDHDVSVVHHHHDHDNEHHVIDDTVSNGQSSQQQQHQQEQNGNGYSSLGFDHVAHMVGHDDIHFEQQQQQQLTQIEPMMAADEHDGSPEMAKRRKKTERKKFVLEKKRKLCILEHIAVGKLNLQVYRFPSANRSIVEAVAKVMKPNHETLFKELLEKYGKEFAIGWEWLNQRQLMDSGLIIAFDLDSFKEKKVIGFASYMFGASRPARARFGEAIATVASIPYGEFVLREIHVRDEYQNQGIGTLIMDEVRHLAKHLKMSKIVVNCFTKCETPMMFFRKHGFTLDDSKRVPPGAKYSFLSLYSPDFDPEEVFCERGCCDHIERDARLASLKDDVGKRVKVFFTLDKQYYFGRIVRVRFHSAYEYYIQYDDGESHWEKVDNVVFLTTNGEDVQGDDGFHHHHHHRGGSFEPVEDRAARSGSKRKRGTTSSSSSIQQGRDDSSIMKRKVGQRVKVYFSKMRQYYFGTTCSVRNQDSAYQFLVQYDDGDRGWVDLDKIEFAGAGETLQSAMSRLVAGKRTKVLYGDQYHYGVVDEVQYNPHDDPGQEEGEVHMKNRYLRFHITFDDGDKLLELPQHCVLCSDNDEGVAKPNATTNLQAPKIRPEMAETKLPDDE